jgi:putative transposase
MLRLATCSRRAAPSRGDRQSQEDPATDARALQPRRRRRYVATTDSDHDQPIYPNRAKDLIVDGPNQLWVADITYVAVVEGFAYVAVILDVWSRRAVGYAICRSIDVRLTLAALNAATEGRRPPPGCIHHSDRGSQYAAQPYREALLQRIPPATTA